jgi:UDP-N-acetylmuramoyl-tripeptide--D-alanyl-D-alanine ligase
MSEVPDRLTLDDLRQYVAESGDGLVRVTVAEPDWAAPLGPAVNDSRDVAPGGLFVALRGEHTDGHRFAAAAAKRGAAALLLARLPDEEMSPQPPVIWLAPDPLRALQDLARWWRARFPRLHVIGITGSVGKTTAKDVIAGALATSMPVLASPRSFNNELGLPLTLLALRGDHRAAVLEMGIYDVGDIALLAGIARQNVGVVMNVDAVHLERAGTIERVAQAKQEIIDTLPSDGVSILNFDDDRVRAMARAAPRLVLTFGLQSGADWLGVDLEPLPDGLALTLVREGARFPIESPLPGRHHAHALLAAAATLEAVGVPRPNIAEALAAVPASAARQQFRQGASGRLVIDDTYNASPLSLHAALELLGAQRASRKVAILADMLELGPASEERHREVGERAGRLADLVIAVGPQARAIADAAGRNAAWFPDKTALREHIDGLLEPGDAVLVKGSRGMGMEEVVAWLLPAS